MKVKLEVIKGPERGKTFVLTEPSTCVVGRSEEAHFKFSEEDPYISKKHFLLEFKPPKVYFRNLDTTNPSKINDLYAEEAELVNGDIVEVGYTKLCVSVEHDVREGSESLAEFSHFQPLVIIRVNNELVVINFGRMVS